MLIVAYICLAIMAIFIPEAVAFALGGAVACTVLWLTLVVWAQKREDRLARESYERPYATIDSGSNSTE